jgi:SHS2 domain-containing protein
MRRDMAFAFEEHTGEVRIRVEGASLAELFVEAARALGELMGATAPPEREVAPERLEVRARDRDALLVAWLDELIYRTERCGRIFSDLRIERAEETRMVAQAWGGRILEPRTAVKAATLHALKIRQQGGGFAAEVVLDV